MFSRTSRLGSEIGLEAAARLYREFAEISVQRFRCLHWADFTIYFDPPEEEEAFRAWLGEDLSYWPQPSGDLGEKLRRGLERMLAVADRALAVGSDIPDLPLAYLEQAAAALPHHDLTIGPAADGGYYLIGLSRPAPELFTNVPWSTPHVLRTTLAKAADLGLSVAILPEWYDVDTAEDLNRLWRSDDLRIQALREHYRDIRRNGIYE
ncbi:MAG: TIGR04282 family arsenosugar biosynthesis glycosyltransferase [bacterium]